jgi:4-amino-4-deoxy-L-arabinose transferase-like glycosyltransferase
MPEGLQSRQVVVLFVVGAIALIGSLSTTSIYILDESKNATCAIEMMDRNDLVVPTFNGELRTDKPVLHYYFMRIAYGWFGQNAFGARFFSGFFGLLTLFLIFQFAKRRFDEGTAFYSVLILVSSIHFITQFHLATPDPYLIFFSTLSIILIYDGYEKRSGWLLLSGYLAMALAFLTKGPIAIAIPGGAFLIFLLLSGDLGLSAIGRLRIHLGILALGVVAGPWYYAVHEATGGEWTEGFFIKHNINRYTDTMEGHGGFFLLMPLILLIGLLPFTGWVLPAFRRAWKMRKGNRPLALAASAAFFVVLFFSFSDTKLPSYVSPALPFAAIVTGFYLQQGISAHNLRRWPWFLSFILGLGLFVGIWFGIKQDPSLKDMPELALYFLPMPIGAGLGLWYGLKDRHRHAIRWNAAGFILATLLFHFFAFPKADSQNPVAQSLDMLHNKEVIAYKRFNPSYAFYLDRPIEKVYSPPELIDRLQNEPDLLVISTKKHLVEIDSIAGIELIFSRKDLFERPTTIILGYNRKSEDSDQE